MGAYAVLDPGFGEGSGGTGFKKGTLDRCSFGAAVCVGQYMG